MLKILEACRRGKKHDLNTIQKCSRLGHNLNLVNENGQTGLILASQNSSNNMVELLISFKVDLNNVDKDGCSALHYACIRCSDTIVKMLIDAGANPNIANKKGITPLMYAISVHRFPIAIQLLNHGVEMELPCNDGSTPLIIACNSWRNNKELVDALLSIYPLVSLDTKSEAILPQNYVNHQDNKGNTALHYGIRDGYRNDIYLELLKHGANPHLRNNNGESVIDILEKMETGPRDPTLFIDWNNKEVKFSIREKISPYAYHPRFASYFGLLDDE
jgi:ankyrin repeat protein